jgi:hypothetical protein
MKRYDTIEIKFPAKGANPALPIHLGRTGLAAIIEAIDTTIEHEMEFWSVRCHEWRWPEDIEKENLLAQRKRMDRMSDHGEQSMRNVGPCNEFCVNRVFTRAPCPHRLSQTG